MRLADLTPHLDLRQVSGSLDTPFRRVTHDSRLAGPEDVFVAIRGAKTDGRALARELRVAAVIADGPVEVRPGVTVLQVADARRALALAAAAAAGFPGRAMPVVGVTGTNGKTTTTWLIEAIGAADGRAVGVIGTTGARIAGVAEPLGFTTPEAPVLQDLLARMRTAGCGLVAMEVSSIGLSLSRVDGIPFAVGVFTSFSQDHLDFHGTMAAYLEAKQRLFQELLAQDGTAVLCGDDPAWAAMVPPGQRTWTYGFGDGLDIRVTDAALGLRGSTATVHTPLGSGDLSVRLPGRHNLHNALGALGAGLALGIPLPTCLDGLAALPRVPGRLDPVPVDAGFDVLVDYAHTPDALERVLATLRPLTAGRLITVFGCGGDRDRSKRPLMGAAASAGSDLVVVTSDNPRSEDPAAILAEILPGVRGEVRVEVDRRQAIALALRAAQPGDCVLIAGKGHEAVQVVGDQTLPFDDRLVAAALLGGTP